MNELGSSACTGHLVRRSGCATSHATLPPGPDLLVYACVYADELQALLHPTDSRGELDRLGAIYIRDHVLRDILVYSPSNVLWAFTGSSMSLVWTALAAMPVNHAPQLHQVLPVS